MAKHKVKATLTGYFEIDDSELSTYEATNIHEAMANQLEWIEDEGDMISFVADTIQNPVLTLDVVIEL